MATSDAYAPFDVVVVPFPYSDRLAEKRRPALVISAASLRSFGLVWLAMITSADNPSWACDVTITDLNRAGLPSPSVVRPAKIACVETTRVLRRAGKLDSAAGQRVRRELERFLPTGRGR
jgi:mRNA interferase MazF